MFDSYLWLSHGSEPQPRGHGFFYMCASELYSICGLRQRLLKAHPHHIFISHAF